MHKMIFVAAASRKQIRYPFKGVCNFLNNAISTR